MDGSQTIGVYTYLRMYIALNGHFDPFNRDSERSFQEMIEKAYGLLWDDQDMREVSLKGRRTSAVCSVRV
jgi:hypothetical protein